MMEDPGPSDGSELPSFFGNQRGHEFPGQVLPISGLQPSVPTSSTDLHPQPLPYSQPLDHHPSMSFRQDRHEEWSHRPSELASGPSSGHRGGAEDHALGGSSHSDDLFTYPEGEADAVTITRGDLEGLQPGRFLSGNIIDFYIKYLSLTILSRENGKRFHFFNSFFFTKLLESSTCMGSDQWKVDYQQLRRWIGEVNLFEKDYVVIPIIQGSHWSLLVICHLKSLDPSSFGELKGPPCILHLDPIEGRHECFQGQVRSLILQAWMDKTRALDNVDVLHALVQMKHVQAKVPQQDNDYDCGLYILHYIEVFLSKIASLDGTLSLCETHTFFTKPNFKVEVSNKRNCIQGLTFKLGGMSQVQDGNHLGLQPMPFQEVGFVHPKERQQQDRPKGVKETKSKKWKETETLILLECMVDGGRFSKGKQGAMHWDLIAEQINTKNIGGPMRSKEQCQNRFDTLLKAYKDLSAYCLKMGKKFCNVTEEEKWSLKLATPLRKRHEVWYDYLDDIYVHRMYLREESSKRQRCNLDVDVSKGVSSPLHLSSKHTPPSDLVGSFKSMHPSPTQDVVKAFNALDVALRYTFLNLIQACSFLKWSGNFDESVSLEHVCRMLAIVQDENPFKIHNHVCQLQDLKLVTVSEMVPHENSFRYCWMDKRWLEISKVCKIFGRKVLSKNPHLDIFLRLSSNVVPATGLCILHEIRVLILRNCEDLEIVDLGEFPNLCYLNIRDCTELKEVKGWESAKRLGWVEILYCPSYCDRPRVEFLFSLKDFLFENDIECSVSIPWQLANFSQCVKLWRLEVYNVEDLEESMDLKGLRFLEVLSFSCWRSLSTIHGLSGLQALKKLDVYCCRNLKMVPELRLLKALTSLDMTNSGIVEIPGVEELHLLTSLKLEGCKSLKSLPPLGHLRALIYLDTRDSNIEEICGVEDLVSLETLSCQRSQLKRLPNLDHLCRLRLIDIHDTPLSRMDPSRSVIGGYELIHNNQMKEGLFVDDISDFSDIINDFEDTSSDEN